MGYIIAAAILALLIVGFTRKTAIVLAVLVALGFLSVGLYLLRDAQRQRQVEARNAAILMTAAHGEGCGFDTPLRITLRNTADQRLDAVTFDLAGFREGHSIPLYRTRGYVSDKIVTPGMGWSDCYPLPQAIRGTDTSGLRENPPNTLRWSIDNVTGRFAG